MGRCLLPRQQEGWEYPFIKYLKLGPAFLVDRMGHVGEFLREGDDGDDRRGDASHHEAVEYQDPSPP